MENKSAKLPEIQRLINTTYPGTYTFDLSPLAPTRVFKRRFGALNTFAPGFFRGKRFLDVGCNTGFFVLYCSDKFLHVTGIDNDYHHKHIEVCEAIQELFPEYQSIEFIFASFRNFTTSELYDRIFIGNGPHHMFREIGGCEWIAKLAAISNGQVLMEGLVDTKSPELEGFIPKELYPKFDMFYSEMDKYFELQQKEPERIYGVGRYLLLYRRKTPTMKANKIVIKEFTHDEYVDNNQVDIFIASTSPVSNGLLGFTEKGWTEEFVTGGFHPSKANSKEIFRQYCIHNEYLSKLGYIDIDPGTVNFSKSALKACDKGATMPIALLKEKHVSVVCWFLKRDYLFITPGVLKAINGILLTRDAVRIEKLFSGLKDGYI